MRDGGMISAYDYQVARAAAVALCGGEVDSGSLVDEAWLLTVERRLFVELLKNPQTQARIQHMLETGKPLPQLIRPRENTMDHSNPWNINSCIFKYSFIDLTFIFSFEHHIII